MKKVGQNTTITDAPQMMCHCPKDESPASSFFIDALLSCKFGGELLHMRVRRRVSGPLSCSFDFVQCFLFCPVLMMIFTPRNTACR